MNRSAAKNFTTAPYTGLRPFEPYESELFFGRAEQVEEMLARLEKNRFLAVVGASGCGKSSLVRAGLLPALADGFLMGAGLDWRFAIARPGDAPFTNLAIALVQAVDGQQLLTPPEQDQPIESFEREAFQFGLVEHALRSSRTGLADALAQCDIASGTAVLILIDQFEELFRFRDQSAKSNSQQTYDARNQSLAFVELLLQSTELKNSQVFVLITMRSDFLGACDEFPGLPEAICRSQFLAPRMTRSQLAEAIVEPLTSVGAQVEDGFVNRVVNDTGSDPDQLPLMQHALLRTWQRACSPVNGPASNQSSSDIFLTIEGYESEGALQGALDKHADLIYESLGKETHGKSLQYAAKRLFCSLSDQRDGSPLTRRAISLSQAALEACVSESDMALVARAFEAGNLIVFSPPGADLLSTTRIDISHESLLRQWARLQKWIDDESLLVLDYRRLLDAVRRGDQELSDTHLAQAEDWLLKIRYNAHWAMRYDGAGSVEQSQLPPCIALIKAGQEARQDRLQKEIDQTRRERELLEAKAASESRRREEAQHAARASAFRTRIALGACLLATMFLVYALHNLQLARLATEKAERSSVEATKSKEEADQSSVEATKSKEEAEQSSVEAKKSKEDAENASRIAQKAQATTSRQNAEYLWKFGWLASNADDANIVKAGFLYLSGAKLLTSIPTSQIVPDDERFESHHKLASQLRVKPLLQTWIHSASVNGAAFNRDESRVLTWSNDRTVKLWDVSKTEPIANFKHEYDVIGASFSGDESKVLTWSLDGTARLWDVFQMESVTDFEQQGSVTGASFNQDASQVLIWGAGGFAGVWDVAKKELTANFKHNSAVNGAIYNRDETRILTWGQDGLAKLWDVTKSETIATFKHDRKVTGALFNHDESRVLTWSWDKTAKLWDITKTEPVAIFKHADDVVGARFNPDESRVLTWSNDSLAKLWDVSTSNPIANFKHDFQVNGAVFNFDGSNVLTWSNKIAKLWEVSKTDPIAVLDHDNEVNGAVFSSYGPIVMTWSNDGAVKLWDISLGKLVANFKHESAVKGAVFDRNESRVLTWCADGTTKLWSVSKTESLANLTLKGAISRRISNVEKTRLLTWGSDNTAKLWDIFKPAQIGNFEHDSQVRGAVFGRDDSRIMTWSSDTAKLWDVSKTEPVANFKHGEVIEGAILNRDESRVLTWSTQHTVKIWDVSQAEPIAIFRHDVQVNGAVLNRSGSRALTWSGDGSVKIWDVSQSEPITNVKHNYRVNGAAFSDDESRVLTWGWNNAKLWEASKLEPIAVFENDSGVISGAVFNRNESRVLTWYTDGTAILWDVSTTKPNRIFKHFDQVNGAIFNRDESRLLTWCEDGIAKLWDVENTEPIASFKHDQRIKGAVFNRDESRVLTWSWDDTAKLWDASKAEPIAGFNHGTYVDGAALNRDESRLMTWSVDTVKIWDISDPLSNLTPEQRLLELEVRSGSTLDRNLNLRMLKYDEWQQKAKSPEYQQIQKVLQSQKQPAVRTQ